MRESTESDIPDLVAMGRKFHAASNELAPFDGDAVANFLAGLIAHDDGIVFRTGKGMIGGILAPAYCDPSWVMAVEMFWWSEDRRGLDLLRGFEKWAKEKGANEVRTATMTNLERASMILEKSGFAPLETSYGKAI